jgi:RNA recognition motif. (a.k.a. RRM, RBD, or RNP domain)
MSVTVCIDRLSLFVSSERLYEVAEQSGTVDRAWIVTAPTGGSLGFGYVEMATAAGAGALVKHLKDTESNVRGFIVDRTSIHSE